MCVRACVCVERAGRGEVCGWGGVTLQSVWVYQSVTDEVVPFGCAGCLVIPLASCLPAAAVTAACAA